MVHRYIRLILISVILLFVMAESVYAADPTVTITFSSKVTTGITGFTITYISDTQLDLDWGYEGDAVAIMIRAKYGEYPDDITSENETPSDGYLVYSGNLTHASDTTMDFDENFGPLYYKAWGQKVDGTYYINTNEGNKESEKMELLFFLFFPLGLTYIASRSSFYLLKFIAGVSWWGLMAYWLANRPDSITAGSGVDTLVVALLVVIGLAVMFMSAWTTRTVNGVEKSGFNIRIPQFLGGKTEEEEATERRLSARTWRDRRDIYQERLDGATRGRRIPPR